MADGGVGGGDDMRVMTTGEEEGERRVGRRRLRAGKAGFQRGKRKMGRKVQIAKEFELQRKIFKFFEKLELLGCFNQVAKHALHELILDLSTETERRTTNKDNVKSLSLN